MTTTIIKSGTVMMAGLIYATDAVIEFEIIVAIGPKFVRDWAGDPDGTVE